MKAIVFDADGVVCVAGPFTPALEKIHGIAPERLRPFFTGVFQECIVGTRDLKETIAPHLSDWGWRGTTDDFLRFWFQQEHRISPEVIACVRALRKADYACYLGTNQEKYRAAYLRSEMGLAAEFDEVFPSCEIGARKPALEYFSALQRSIGRPPAEILLVDDTEANIRGAQNSGWAAIHYKTIADIPRIMQAASRNGA